MITLIVCDSVAVFTSSIYMPAAKSPISSLRLMMPDRDDTLDLPVMWRFKKHSIADSTLVVGLEFGEVDGYG